MSVRMETERFILRELNESDVSKRYLDWFRDPNARTNIVSASQTSELEDLRRFILERSGRQDVLFLGIFDKASGTHIGNVKYEPVDDERGYAVMGLLIGDASYRGKGVASEVLVATGDWLRRHRGIREIVLGVRRDNAGAIRAYEKAGYRVATSAHVPALQDDSVMMVRSV